MNSATKLTLIGLIIAFFAMGCITQSNSSQTSSSKESQYDTKVNSSTIVDPFLLTTGYLMQISKIYTIQNYINQSISISFTKEGQILGTIGCENYTGNYVIIAKPNSSNFENFYGTIRIFNISVNQTNCTSYDNSGKIYLQFLQNSTKYYANNDSLGLFGDNSEFLQYNTTGHPVGGGPGS